MEWNTILTMLIGLFVGWLFTQASGFLSSRKENKKMLKSCFYTLLKIEMIASSLYKVIKDYKSLEKPDELQKSLINSLGEEHVNDFKNLKESLIEVIKEISKIDPFLSFGLQSFSLIEEISSMAVTLTQSKANKGMNPMEAFSPSILNGFLSKVAFKIGIWFWLRYYLYKFKQRNHKQFSLIKI